MTLKMNVYNGVHDKRVIVKERALFFLLMHKIILGKYKSKTHSESRTLMLLLLLLLRCQMLRGILDKKVFCSRN